MRAQPALGLTPSLRRLLPIAGTVWGVVYEAQGIQVAPFFLEELGVQAMVREGGGGGGRAPRGATEALSATSSPACGSALQQRCLLSCRLPLVDQLTLGVRFLLPPAPQTLGNHEFDDGVANLADFIRNTTFPVLSCNLDTSAEPLLDGLVEVRRPPPAACAGPAGLVRLPVRKGDVGAWGRWCYKQVLTLSGYPNTFVALPPPTHPHTQPTKTPKNAALHRD
jgi:hypothetical protein